MSARRVALRGLGTLLGLSAQVALAQAPAGAPVDSSAALPLDLPGVVHFTDFEASAFAHLVGGSLLWLPGPDGILRVEIRPSDPADDHAAPLSLLLAQEGAGWTAVLGGQGSATVNAWGQEWRRLPPGLAQLARLVSEYASAGPDLRVPGQGPWRARSQEANVVRCRVAALRESGTGPSTTGFRGTLTARGGGRPPAQEIIEMAWQAAAGSAPARLRVRATGRPGELALAAPGSQRVVYAMPEAFVPLWPLADLVSLVP